MSVPFMPMPQPRELRRCECGELLTLECEHDVGVCVDCMAEAARESENLNSPQRIPA